MKLIKREKGALSLKLKGENNIVLNWSDLMVEVYHNGNRKFVIDLRGD